MSLAASLVSRPAVAREKSVLTWIPLFYQRQNFSILSRATLLRQSHATGTLAAKSVPTGGSRTATRANFAVLRAEPSEWQHTTILSQRRSFGSSKARKKRRKNMKKQAKPVDLTLSKAERKRRQRKREEEDRDRRFRQEKIKKLKRQRNLHPAAKMKRVLSASDYWFSRTNLITDFFMREQLKLYDGYIPLSVLLTFPKFQYWTDLQLLYDSFTNPAAHRFRLIIDKKRFDHAEAETKRQEESIKQEEREFKERQRMKKRLASRLKQRREAQRRERMSVLVESHRAEAVKLANRIKAQERTEIIAKKRAELAKETYSIRGFLERRREKLGVVSTVLDYWEKLEEVEKKWNLPEFETVESITDSAVIDLCSLKEKYFDFIYEEDEAEEEAWLAQQEEELLNKKKQSAQDPLGEQEDSSERNEGDTDFEKDTSHDIRYALVRHKRVTLDYIRDLESGNTGSFDADESDYVDADDIFHDSSYDDVSKDIMLNRVDGIHFEEDDDSLGIGSEIGDEDSNDEKILDMDVAAATSDFSKVKPDKAKKRKKLKVYTSEREIILISTPKKLAGFCDKLQKDIRKSVELNNGDPNASAVGFDVEFCTLELDIRGNLPAMVQLAGPTSKSIVGLIWLDKFPNHGRDMLADKMSEPLLKILSNPSILKVGVNSQNDAKHLAAWWGITDSDYVVDYITGVIDMNEEVETEKWGDGIGLAGLCEAVLGNKLPKIKQKLSGRDKKRKKQGRKSPTAHWRIDSSKLTQKMKVYAANDSSSGIDIWMKIKNLAQK